MLYQDNQRLHQGHRDLQASDMRLQPYATLQIHLQAEPQPCQHCTASHRPSSAWVGGSQRLLPLRATIKHVLSDGLVTFDMQLLPFHCTNTVCLQGRAYSRGYFVDSCHGCCCLAGSGAGTPGGTAGREPRDGGKQCSPSGLQQHNQGLAGAPADTATARRWQATLLHAVP